MELRVTHGVPFRASATPRSRRFPYPGEEEVSEAPEPAPEIDPQDEGEFRRRRILYVVAEDDSAEPPVVDAELFASCVLAEGVCSVVADTCGYLYGHEHLEAIQRALRARDENAEVTMLDRPVSAPYGVTAEDVIETMLRSRYRTALITCPHGKGAALARVHAAASIHQHALVYIPWRRA
jgi:hypothetical protein